jgi:hypothetical protein
MILQKSFYFFIKKKEEIEEWSQTLFILQYFSVLINSF